MRRAELNQQSITAAVGWSSLFNGFTDDPSKKIKPVDLVPCPDMMEQAERRISHRTTKVLVRLITHQKLPPRVIAAALQINEVRKELGY